MTTRTQPHAPRHAPRHGRLRPPHHVWGYVPSRPVIDKYQESNGSFLTFVKNRLGRCYPGKRIENVELFESSTGFVTWKKAAK